MLWRDLEPKRLSVTKIAMTASQYWDQEFWLGLVNKMKTTTTHPPEADMGDYPEHHLLGVPQK